MASHSASTASRETALLELALELSRELHPARRTRGLTPDSSLERDAGLDSLARVELLLRAEKRLGMRLPDHAVLSAETFRDFLAAVETAPARPPVDASAGAALESGTSAEEEWPETAETLVEALEWHAQRHPDRPQIHYLGDGETAEAITHGELWMGARRIAAGLRALDLEPGRTVAIMLPSGRPYFETFMGTLMASGAAVPLYPPTRIHRLEEHVRRQARIMANAQASVLVTFEEVKRIGGLLKALLPDLRAIVTPAELAREPGGERLRARGGDLAFLQYTSGSTGDPKGVMLTHANLLANIRAMIRGCAATPAETFVSWLPLYHDMGLIGAWLAVMCAGARLVLMSPVTFMGRPARWLRAISAWKGTLSAAPNFAYEICARKLDDADLRGLDISSWRVAFNGAEPVHPETLERFAARFAPYGFRREALAPVYGLAENSVGVTFPPTGRGPRVDRVKRREFLERGWAEPAGPDDANALTFVGCGSPLTTVEVRIVDEAGREAADRARGRVEFRGPSAMAGYYRNAAATRRVLDRGWVDSGDLGYIAEGELYVTGRTKDMIIRGGRNIHPQELEEAVGNVSGIRLGFVAVFGTRDARSSTERLVVVAETRATQREDREKLVSKICDLSSELLEAPPDDVVLLPPGSVPKTPSGKIRRSACRELYEKGELGRKRPSAGLQIVRLALSGLGPGARSRVARRGAHSLRGVVLGNRVRSQRAGLARDCERPRPCRAPRSPSVQRPSLAPPGWHPRVRRRALEHPPRAPLRARAQPLELPGFLRPGRGTPSALCLPRQKGARPERLPFHLPPSSWYPLRRARRRRTRRPGHRGRCQRRPRRSGPCRLPRRHVSSRARPSPLQARRFPRRGAGRCSAPPGHDPGHALDPA